MRVVCACLAAMAIIGCGDSPSGPSSLGTLNLMIKDSPFGEAKSLLVTFSEVSAHQAETEDGDSVGEWRTLPFADSATTRTCDLKKLETAQDILGTGPLAAGHYTQLRLRVSSAVLYFDNAAAGPACAPSIAAPSGRSAPVEISSGDVKLNRQFEVPEGGATTILVDFDGERSVHEAGSGRYRMSPVIAVVSVQ